MQLLAFSQEMITNGTYQYSRNLLALNSFIGAVCRTASLLSLEAFSLLNQTQWLRHLISYPDKIFSIYILEGIKLEFGIGFGRTLPLQSAVTISTLQQSFCHFDYLAREVSLNRMWKYPLHYSPLVSTLVQWEPSQRRINQGSGA